MTEKEGSSGFGFGQLALAFLGGAAAGAAVAYLTAPRSGEQTRAGLRAHADSARQAASRVPEAFREAADAAREAFEEALAKQHRHG